MPTVTNRIAPVPPSFLARTLYPRVTVEQYHQMIEDGVFEDGEPIELVEGYLVLKMSHNSPYANAVAKLTKRLIRLAPEGWEVRSQLPITFPDSEPEPDAVLARGDETTFTDRHPEPADIALVIEVADSSRYADRTEKLRMYARAGVPVYWIVNVADKQVEVYCDPDAGATPPAYRTRTDYKPGDSAPVVLDGTAVAHLPVAELVG
jgi:Uma2 family endonuclease